MENISRLLKEADFSKETQLKSQLFAQLFDSRREEPKEIPFTGRRRLSEDELLQVNAAMGISKEVSVQELATRRSQATPVPGDLLKIPPLGRTARELNPPEN